MIEYIEPLIEGINDLISNPRMIIMWFISGFLYYFGIYKKKEPLLLVPISTGILLANLPMGELLREGGNGEQEQGTEDRKRKERKALGDNELGS